MRHHPLRRSNNHDGFNSRTPGGVRLRRCSSGLAVRWFQFTHPGRGATSLSSVFLFWFVGFQFTHPGRGATLRSIPVVDGIEVSIHAPREGCDASSDLARVLSEVSIHAPREGCDDISEVITTAQTVSIHAPREGCDLSVKDLALRILMFQFTHPGRGATCQRRGRYSSSQRRFNSRTPGGVRLTA